MQQLVSEFSVSFSEPRELSCMASSSYLQFPIPKLSCMADETYWVVVRLLSRSGQSRRGCGLSRGRPPGQAGNLEVGVEQ